MSNERSCGQAGALASALVSIYLIAPKLATQEAPMGSYQNGVARSLACLRARTRLCVNLCVSTLLGSFHLRDLPTNSRIIIIIRLPLKLFMAHS